MKTMEPQVLQRLLWEIGRSQREPPGSGRTTPLAENTLLLWADPGVPPAVLLRLAKHELVRRIGAVSPPRFAMAATIAIAALPAAHQCDSCTPTAHAVDPAHHVATPYGACHGSAAVSSAKRTPCDRLQAAPALPTAHRDPAVAQQCIHRSSPSTALTRLPGERF